MVEKDDLQSKATDFVKKVLTVGVGAIFLTEESLRNLVTEFKLPRELLTGLLESAGKTKNEFLRGITDEVITQVADRVDPQEFMREFLSKNEVTFEIKVKLKPTDPA